MPTHVYANNNEIASKACDGKSIAAFPDVCFSPPAPPVGPMPLPYPNTGECTNTDKGTSKVFIKDKMSGMEGDSNFSKSMGDESATQNFTKGMITSALQGKCYFGLWSMDVQMEGKGVPRHLDIVTHNHASMPGDTGGNPAVITKTIENTVQESEASDINTEDCLVSIDIKRGNSKYHSLEISKTDEVARELNDIEQLKKSDLCQYINITKFTENLYGEICTKDQCGRIIYIRVRFNRKNKAKFSLSINKNNVYSQDDITTIENNKISSTLYNVYVSDANDKSKTTGIAVQMPYKKDFESNELGYKEFKIVLDSSFAEYEFIAESVIKKVVLKVRALRLILYTPIFYSNHLEIISEQMQSVLRNEIGILNNDLYFPEEKSFKFRISGSAVEKAGEEIVYKSEIYQNYKINKLKNEIKEKELLVEKCKQGEGIEVFSDLIFSTVANIYLQYGIVLIKRKQIIFQSQDHDAMYTFSSDPNSPYGLLKEGNLCENIIKQKILDSESVVFNDEHLYISFVDHLYGFQYADNSYSVIEQKEVSVTITAEDVMNLNKNEPVRICNEYETESEICSCMSKFFYNQYSYCSIDVSKFESMHILSSKTAKKIWIEMCLKSGETFLLPASGKIQYTLYVKDSYPTGFVMMQNKANSTYVGRQDMYLKPFVFIAIRDIYEDVTTRTVAGRQLKLSDGVGNFGEIITTTLHEIGHRCGLSVDQKYIFDDNAFEDGHCMQNCFMKAGTSYLKLCEKCKNVLTKMPLELFVELKN